MLLTLQVPVHDIHTTGQGASGPSDLIGSGDVVSNLQLSYIYVSDSSNRNPNHFPHSSIADPDYRDTTKYRDSDQTCFEKERQYCPAITNLPTDSQFPIPDAENRCSRMRRLETAGHKTAVRGSDRVERC